MLHASNNKLISKIVARYFISMFPERIEIVLTGMIGTIAAIYTLFYSSNNCQRLIYGYRMKLIDSRWSQ